MEKFIKRISASAAGIVVFLLAASFYLQLKGFVRDDENFLVLPRAYAEETGSAQKEIPANFAFPQDHILGNKDAKVSIYEYSSFGCSHCADMHLEVMPEIVKKYVNAGLVRIVFVPLPLDKNSMDAALLAECVAPEKYFNFAEILFKHQRDWAIAFEPQKVLLQYAKLSGVGDSKAQACLRNDVAAARILGDRKVGLDELGKQGTPTLIVSSGKGNEMVLGADFEGLSKIVDAHLAAIYNENAK